MDLTDEELIRRAVQYPPTGRGEHCRWSLVGAVFSLGSTSSIALCRRFGCDPDDRLGRYEDDDPDDEDLE